MSSVGYELLNVPFGDMVYQLASSIANAQTKLDQNSIEILKLMGDKDKAPVYLPSLVVDDKGNFSDKEIETSMIGAGFQPTFYQFAETIIEVKMAISLNYENTYENKVEGNKKSLSLRGRKVTVTSTPINATYTSKYNYSQEGASTIRTRLVPVPPNTIIERQIELKAQYLNAKFDAEVAKAENALNGAE